MGAGLGDAGRRITALLAVLLTMGTMNTYVAAATRLAGRARGGRQRAARAGHAEARARRDGEIAGTLLLVLALELVDVDALMRATSALFVAVYVTATAAGNKLLEGRRALPRGSRSSPSSWCSRSRARTSSCRSAIIADHARVSLPRRAVLATQ